MILTSEEQFEAFARGYQIENFSAKEFVCPHCGELYIHSDLIITVQDLRRKLGRPVIITSAYRCEEYNAQIGGVPNSAHTLGLALDIAVPNSQMRKYVLEHLIMRGISRIGIAKDFIHFDIDVTKPQDVVWLYGTKRHVA